MTGTTAPTGGAAIDASAPPDHAAASAAADRTAEMAARARRMAAHCAAYKGADRRRSLIQLATTTIPFVAVAGMMAAAYEQAYWLTLLLAVPAAGLIVRFFIIQHDCGHGSFFASRRANDLVGRAISVLTLTPYGMWRRAHAVHHATSGHLGRRGVGDVTTLTVREYRALPRRRRLVYRLYRNPLVLLVFGAPYHFVIGQRLPFGQSMPFAEVWRSVTALNLAIVGLYGAAALWLGAGAVLLIWLPAFVLAAWIGGWLFFVQHQFEHTVWEDGAAWDFYAAAVFGSSHYLLPRVLQWFTGNIGLHHIHHLCGRIPNYRLQECFDSCPDFPALNRLTLVQSLKSLRLALWDEDTRRLVPFRHLRGLPAAA